MLTDPLMLPLDLLVVPVNELPGYIREKIECRKGDCALTRPHSRSPSLILNAQAAELLKEFREPVTIVQAVIRYSAKKNADPEQTLEEAFPMLERLFREHLLIAEGSKEEQQIRPLLEAGMRFAEAEVLRCVQVCEDTEVYCVRTSDNGTAALKIQRPNVRPEIAQMFDREAETLKRLDGTVNAKLLRSGMVGQHPYLLVEWCSGEECSIVAAKLRWSGSANVRQHLIRLCTAILDAYARLHAQGVIHSDIHPRNVFVGGEYVVKIIDFGLARVTNGENEFERVLRGGIGLFFEPEYAKAVMAGAPPPPSSLLGEQYSLAALLYFLITGWHYLDFSLEKNEMLRQIAESTPLHFTRRGIQEWPELEQLLLQALSKHPLERFPSVAEFAEKLRSLARSEPESVALCTASTVRSAYPAAEDMLQRMLARVDRGGSLFESGLNAGPRVSVTFGSAGIAYGLYRIACAREDARLLALSDLWAARASRDSSLKDAFYCPEIEITPDVVGNISPYHTASGVHVVQGLIAQAMGDALSQEMAIKRFLTTVTAASCESLDLTLGQSSVLIGASLLLDAIPDNTAPETSSLMEFGNRTFNRIWVEVRELPPIRECRKIAYLGVAHGWAGILFATMRWCCSSGTALPDALQERLEQLSELAEYVGRRARWRCVVHEDHYKNGGMHAAGWCNGSAGFVHLWTLAHRMLGNSKHGVLAERAGFDVAESKGPLGNLCCGYAGQAYALVNLYKHTLERSWLRRAENQAQLAARSMVEFAAAGIDQELALRTESLYYGELGIAVLASDLQNPEFAAMPFFESAR
jgi:eukaryotic-like serine/threonine-protein kinase